MKKIFGLALVALVGLSGSVLAGEQYNIDKSHSTLGFSVAHMMVSKTTGQFADYEGTIQYDPNDLAASVIKVKVKVDSIDTRDAKRDGHLKSPDFFDVAQFPEMTFVSKSISTNSITGDLTIKGVTKEVTIPATISGPVVTPFGSTVIGINATFSINRQDYGLNWNKALDKGGVAVGNDVTVSVSIEAAKS